MATRSSSSGRFPVPAFVLLFLFFSAPPSADAFPYGQLHTLISLSHSLVSRVANLRAAKGDLAGSRRARVIAGKLERGLGLGFFGSMWSVTWDYVRNYAWRDDRTASFQLSGLVSDASELIRSLNELTRLDSDVERAAWVGRNYRSILALFKSLFDRMLAVFRKSGPLRELVETLQTELEGDFLRDCLELGAGDLKEVALQVIGIFF
ncbi:hypothetical protein Dimus_037381 [Dionaea muscipula]